MLAIGTGAVLLLTRASSGARTKSMCSACEAARAPHTLCHLAVVHRAEDVCQELGRVLLRTASTPAVPQGMAHERGERRHYVQRGRTRVHVCLFAMHGAGRP